MNEETLINILDDLHTFNILTDGIVNILSFRTGIDCAKLCRDNGITYNLRELDNVPFNEPKINRK